jgi:RimJ/RimL family protein N-acetyltransferase
MLKFEPIKEQHLPLLLKWRLSARVDKYMFTSVQDDMNMQRKWFEISHAKEYDGILIHSLITWLDKPIGYVQINNIDKRNSKADWGYYIGDYKSKAIGALVPKKVYKKVFLDLGLNKLIAECLPTNTNVIAMHQLEGYRDVGTYKQHVLKGDKYLDVRVFELLRSEWMKRNGHDNS